MKKGRKLIAALTASVLLASIPVSTYGAVVKFPESMTELADKANLKDLDVEDLIKSGQMTLEQIQNMGPGYAEEIAKTYGSNVVEGLAEALNVDSGFKGPVVGQTNLTEIYHEKYKTYEESLAGIFFLYSNVGNGGITHEPVVVDIPANLSYVMEKDGLPIPYISREYIYEKGTYVLKLTGIENPDLPLSEQVEYKATFRFRIQDEPPVEETEAPAGVQEFASAVLNGGGSANGETVSGGSSGSSSMWDNMTGVLDLSGKDQAESSDQNTAEPETMEDSVNETEPAKEPEVSANKESDADVENAQVQTPQKEEQPRTQTFDPATGNYMMTLENGKQITTSVPEGFVGNTPVYLSVSEGDAVAVKLFKNDEQVSFINNEAVAEIGRYRLELDGDSYFFTIASQVSGMDYYPAPAGMKFTEVRWNEEILELRSDQYAPMKEEGTYVFSMVDQDRNRTEVVLVKDETAPVVNVMVNGSSAAIQYGSDDIESIVLYQNGEKVSFNGSSIQTPGNYHLVVTDGAGNETAVDFALTYRINGFGIAAILLIIATIIGGVVFVVITKRKVKVR